MNISLQVVNLGKRYNLGGAENSARYATLRDTLNNMFMAPIHRLRSVIRNQSATISQETIWALKDINFEVREGEVVGIIGRHGAGKSTLLKVLSQITEPTEGYADVYGRVGSLLEVGTGFHPELTGRENTFLNGAILGMSRHEIERKFDEIVEFSGVERFIDTPVKHYSSGMQVRLAFAVAAHLDPEILLVDEVLAVGDAAFQKKCLGKMGNVARSGRTVLLVSHNMSAIMGLCDRAIWIDEGQVRADGPADEVVKEYITSFKEKDTSSATSISTRSDRAGEGQVRIIDFEMRKPDGNPTSVAIEGEPIELIIHYVTQTDIPLSAASGFMSIRDEFETPLLPLSGRLTGESFDHLPREGAFICSIPRFPLIASTYYVSLGIRIMGRTADWVVKACELKVVSGNFFGTGTNEQPVFGRFLAEHSWRLTE